MSPDGRGPSAVGRWWRRTSGRRRTTVLVTALVAYGMLVGGIVLATGGGPAQNPAAIRAAIAKFAVKPIDLASITYSASAASALSASASANTVSTSTPLPPSSGATQTAPPDFAQQLDGLYQQITSVNAQAAAGAKIPGTAPPETTAEFDQAVANLDTQELDQFYTGAQQTPNWSNIPTYYNQISAGLSKPASGSSSAPSSGTLRPAISNGPVSSSSGSPYPYPNSATTTTFAPATPQTTDPSTNAANCPAPAPGGDYGEDSIYAAQLAIDAFTTVDSIIPKDLTLGVEAAGEGDVSTFPDPAWIADQALLAAAEVTHDTLAWRQAIANDCNVASEQNQVTVIDSNVDYLTSLVDSRTTALENEAELIYALVDSQTTLILNKLAVVQATINLQIEVVIAQDLLQGAAGAVVELEEPASAGGYLDAVPIGVQAIVTNSLNSMQQAGELANPAAPQDLASANAALAAGNYKQAFSLYSQTYKEIVG